MPAVSVAVQGVRASARLAAAGPNPFSATGTTTAALLHTSKAHAALSSWQGAFGLCALNQQTPQTCSSNESLTTIDPSPFI